MMTEQSDRSSAPNRLPMVVGVLIGVVALVVVLVVSGVSWPTGSQPSGECVRLEVSSSTEKVDLMADLADRYNGAERVFTDDQGEDRCARLTVHGLSSGSAMAALAGGWDEKRDGGPPPQVWTPTSSLWLGQLEHRGKGALVVGESEPITNSVLTIAMPERMAAAVREEYENPGWASMLKLTRESWDLLDRPEWGPFVLGRDNPHVSTSGLAATIAIYHAAAKNPDGIKPDQLDDAGVRSFVHGVESGVLQYGNDATKFMAQMYDEDRKKLAVPYVSAVLVQEQLAFQFNKGAPGGDAEQMRSGTPPNEPLVAIHPSEGTFELDHPFVVLSSASPAQRAAAADFRTFLLEPEQQQNFADIGFRGLDGTPGADLADTLGFDEGDRPELIEPPTPEMVERMITGWDAASRRARVLVVLDVSGSMNDRADASEPPGPAAKTKMDLLRPAVLQGLGWLSDRDEVGLWTFSSGSPKPYKVYLPMSPVIEVRQRFADIVSTVPAQGETALYQTVRDAHQMMVDSIDPKKINAVVVLTDGNNKPPDPAARAAMLREIDPAQRDNSVRIFTIPYGSDADVTTLAELAAVSKALTYPATDPADINEVFVSVFSNF